VSDREPFPGQSVEECLYQSITDPGAYGVPGFPDNLMSRTHRELFTDEQIGDLIAAILWHGGDAGRGKAPPRQNRS